MSSFSQPPQTSSQQVNEASDLVGSSLDGFLSLLSRKELLYNTSDWLIGSDTWASDLGRSVLHHAITSGQNINVLIVDTSPYSSQIAEERKKDINLYAINYGPVYVASVALYYSYTGVLHALMEADTYNDPSIVHSYLPQFSGAPDNALARLKETTVCVDNGSWPLYKWNPDLEQDGQEMFTSDSQRIKKELEAYLARESYLNQLVASHTDISNILTSSLEKLQLTISPICAYKKKY